ncbi:MAG: iron ABC transporter permease [Endomicrobium sp.]|jgi:iron complex transport system permease protein|nr:iron ABC transporter permease [Endomicrobium sp.]
MKKKIIISIILLLLLLSILLSLLIGFDEYSFIDIFNIIFNHTYENNHIFKIIKYIRIPKIIMICITGGGLATSGCVLQAILHNPLADPFTLGISGGAAFGAMISLLLNLSSKLGFITMPLCAFVGAMISMLIVYILSFRKHFNPHTMILSGIIVSSVCMSIVMLVFILSPIDSIYMTFTWLLGNFSILDERLVIFTTTIVTLCILLILLLSNILNIIYLGNDKVTTLGLNINKYITIFFLLTSLITATIVSISGIIGFVGLIIPNICKSIVGDNNVVVIPFSAYTGALLLLLCDSLSNFLFRPIVLPIGIITNILGSLFFIFLLLQKKNK